MLPVTVRNVEPSLQGQNLAVAGQSLRVEGSDGKIAEWLRTVDSADDYDVEDITKGDEVVGHIQNTGSKPILTGADAGSRDVKIGLPGKGKDFEVVGIPLSKPGFYVVELASPVLGQALLGRKAPRYVATAALVTNMAVHFKWGREKSLAWVTSLDSGQPVGERRGDGDRQLHRAGARQRQDRPIGRGVHPRRAARAGRPMADRATRDRPTSR